MCAVPNLADLSSSLSSCFPGMLLRYCLSYFEMVPVAPIVTGINFSLNSSCVIIIIIIIIASRVLFL
jgi:hypothetical protein